MGETVRYIKIKKEDGTITDKIPIGVDAKNITLDSGNNLEFEINKKPYYFNTVAEMISAKYLKENDYAITIGYYEINDGGGAKYIITRHGIENNIDCFKINDHLYANLIYNNEIFLNALGAKNDATIDCSNILQYAINKINDNFLSNNNFNTIVFNGNYLINNQIIVPPFVHLTSNGYVQIKTNVQSDSVFHIKYINNSLPDQYIRGEAFNHHNIFDFTKGALIYDLSGAGTCIEIGQDIDGSLNVGRFSLDNICISSYNIALLLNPYDMFINFYSRLYLIDNNIDVQFSKNETLVSNTGENINFDKCILANSNYGFVFEAGWGYDVYVTNSSIDYVLDIFQDKNSKGHLRLFFDTCHFEGFKHITNKMTSNTWITIRDSEIMDSYNTVHPNVDISHQFVYDSASNVKMCGLNLFNCNLNTNPTNNYNPLETLQLSNLINIKNCTSTMEGFHSPSFNKKSLIYSFDNITDGDYSVYSGGA